MFKQKPEGNRELTRLVERRRKENVIHELGKCIKTKRFRVRSILGIEKSVSDESTISSILTCWKGRH